MKYLIESMSAYKYLEGIDFEIVEETDDGIIITMSDEDGEYAMSYGLVKPLP